MIHLFLATVVMLLFYHVFSTTDTKLPYSYKQFGGCGCANVSLREKKVDQLPLSRRIGRFRPRYKKNWPKTNVIYYLLLMPVHLPHVLWWLLSKEFYEIYCHSARLPDHLP